MSRRKILKATACLLVGIILLCSCANYMQKTDLSTVISSNASSKVRPFLETHSEQDLQYLFTMISGAALPHLPEATDPYPYYGFKNTSELSANGLYNFFLNFCDQTEAESYWHEEDKRYHIPISFVRKTLDHYFEGYEFNPEDITYECGYQAEEQVFVTPGIVGHDLRNNGVKISTTEQNVDGDITLKAKTLDLDDPTKETGNIEILVLHPTEAGFHFISYQIIPA